MDHLFFLGILLAVGSLQAAGQLGQMAIFLDNEIGTDKNGSIKEIKRYFEYLLPLFHWINDRPADINNKIKKGINKYLDFIIYLFSIKFKFIFIIIIIKLYSFRLLFYYKTIFI